MTTCILMWTICQKNQRAGGEETSSETSQYFSVVAVVFPPSFIAVHSGNYTAKVIAKQQTPSEGGNETGETNPLARGAV